nr:reverse transcriptase domain-containing protein [Tanacetum cinerariifolium]
NALNVNDQDSLNSAAGGNFLDKMPRVCLKIIESKSKVRQSRAKAVVAKVGTSSSTPAISSEVAELKDMVRALLLDKKNQSPALTPSTTPAPVKAVESNCVTCGGTLPGNTVTNPKEDLKGITTRSGVAYQGPKTPSPSKQETKVTKDQVQTPSPQSTAHVQPPITQSETPVSKPIAAPVSASMPNLKLSISYPSRCDNERCREQANEQIEKFYEIFKDMKKLSEMARTSMNEHCSTVILNKLPKKLRDPGKFLILCEFPRMDECLALADLGASINLMPLSVWKELSLPELIPTCMTLELTDRSISKPIGIAKDVKVKVGMFHFLANFVVVDFEPDPRVPLILGRCFLKIGHALIDVHKGELTLRIGNEAITYNLDQTSRYSANYDQMMANKIDVTDEAYEGDFLLFEEANAFLGLEDDLDSSKLDPSYYDPEGDIQMLEAILNNHPVPSLPNHEQFVPSFTNELKACEAKTIKSFDDEPPEVELKDLPPHLEYAFLEGDNNPVHCVPKKGGFIVIKNEENKLIPTCLVTGWQTMEVFMDDFSVFGNSFETCRSQLDKMLQRIPRSPSLKITSKLSKR